MAFTPAPKITVIDCGVRLSDYEAKVDRIPGRLIYCSVPDRGLVVLHKAWPIIKAAVPSATLVITSDYRLWGLPAGNQNHRLAWAGLPGVDFLGAVPRGQLCRLQQQADIMAYPCTDEELFCISVAECQVAGAVPVTPNIGALATTNQFGIVMKEPVNSGGFPAIYARQVIRLLTSAAASVEQKRQTMMANARSRFRIERIAEQWESVLRGDSESGGTSDSHGE